MKRILAVAAAVLFVMAVCGSAYAQDRATCDEAKKNLAKAVEFAGKHSKEETIKVFNDKNSQFNNYKDLYVFVFDFDVKNLAHGADPKLVGKNLRDLKDADGKYFMREMINKGKSGSGQVEYKWKNKAGKTEPKITYVKKYKDWVVGCGCYK